MKYLLSILIIFFSLTGYSQIKDTTKIHSPRTAALRSLALPGWGQAYNKKYWKIPIIYGAFTGLYFMASFNQKELTDAETSLIQLENGETITSDFYNITGITTAQITERVDDFRRNRDFAYILMGLTYLLNVVDANVDAHLIDYNVSDDLTLKLQPNMEQNAYIGISNGLKLSMVF